jgi:acetaldehyde dehydrogenase
MIGAAVIGSGNIGTDQDVMGGIDPASDGLVRAARLGVATTAGGTEGLVRLPGFAGVGVVFDASSAAAHPANAAVLAPRASAAST